MTAISKITIDGFKAFPKEFELDLQGKNLLMYGENGSGKSSIYYALHALLQSQYHDKGPIYFNKDNHESLVNKYTSTAEPYIEIELEGSNTKYHLSETGYKETPTQPISPLRDMNAECVFINHKFLFNSFSFRNSQYIDLFPVFIKDILPFILTRDNSEYIGSIYDDVKKGIQRHGTSNQIKESYKKRIEKFNLEVKNIIAQINLYASNIYAQHFKDEGDKDLKITLEYENNKDRIPSPNRSYWLRCAYRYQRVNKAGVWKVKQVSSGLEILQPSIMLKIEEESNGIYKQIEKPQTYFNEARLTAIILAIRFSLLDTIATEDGRFMALDDMLISLDMSNRAKVVDFLLNLSDKYRIYLFTHDRIFFDYFKERIFYNNKSKGLKKEEGWLFKELYKDNSLTNNPKIFNSDSDITKAHKHYEEFDYPASANYLRKAVEFMIKEIFPPKLSLQDNGLHHDKLRNILEVSFDFFSKIPDFDKTDLSRLISNLNLLMNPLSHKSTETNVYKTELNEIFAIIERLSLQIQKLDIKEILPRKGKVYLSIQQNEHITQKYEIELQQELYTYIIAGSKRIWQPESKSTRSCTITDGIMGEYTKNEHFKGNLEKVCRDIHTYKTKEYLNNYLELYRDQRGNLLSNLI